MRNFAFIFARGGSKGLPGKNIKPLNGIPLLAYSINCAKSNARIDRVFVSTDCNDIASVANEYGAEVIQRPLQLATDTASEWMAWRHAVKYVRETLGLSFDRFISLPATSPLRNQEDIDACISMHDGSCDVVITVTPSARSPYFNMVKLDGENKVSIVLGDAKFNRRQDVPSVYDITTVAYVATPDFIESNERIFDGVVKSVVVPRVRAVDIDDEIDFLTAEACLSLIK